MADSSIYDFSYDTDEGQDGADNDLTGEICANLQREECEMVISACVLEYSSWPLLIINHYAQKHNTQRRQ